MNQTQQIDQIKQNKIVSPLLDREQEIYTIAQLNAQARHLVEAHFAAVWVMGEISNLVRPRSGHCYFSLKDATAQVRCVLFRSIQQGLPFQLESGQQVLVQAQVSIYEARGDYQLIVSSVQQIGDGALQLAFNRLKQKLTAEGLFDVDRKAKVPSIPHCVGIVTSPSGAAVHDILSVLARRCPTLSIVIYPSVVQGDHAAKQLIDAIQIANQRDECDVLILARGGGSLEDLWPFNEESLARAISASAIPIVTGIGHEVDFTIADYVADQRCPTPSAAAEYLSPDSALWLTQLNAMEKTLSRIINIQLKQAIRELGHLSKRLQHPGQRLRQQQERLEELKQRLMHATQQQWLHKQEKLQLTAQHLHTVSPLNTLKRGYAILTNDQATVISCAQQVKVGESLQARLSEGSLSCVVTELGD